MGLGLAAVGGLVAELGLGLVTGTSEGLGLGQGGRVGYGSLGCSLPPSSASSPPPPEWILFFGPTIFVGCQTFRSAPPPSPNYT